MNAKAKAIQLRKDGYSYSYIVKATGLSKSTLSYHLAEIPYLPNTATSQSLKKSQLQAAATKHRQKNQRIEKAKFSAARQLGVLSDRDLLIFGIGLYVGEGSKTQGLVRLVNTDYRVIKSFIAWLKMLDVETEQIALRVHVYPDTDIARAEEFWLQKTKLPPASLQRACIDVRANKSKIRAKTHLYGTAHVTVRAMGRKDGGVQLARKIGTFMEEMLKYQP